MLTLALYCCWTEYQYTWPKVRKFRECLDCHSLLSNVDLMASYAPRLDLAYCRAPALSDP